MFQHITPPSDGKAITRHPDGTLCVPDTPIITFIEGDGIGADITPVMKTVVDTAVNKSYDSHRHIAWMEIYAGEKATRIYGSDTWIADETFEALRTYKVGFKGPLMTPVGGGIRSLNVALRQKLDLYVCLRPVRYFAGTPSPVKHPERVDMVIFRENTEDIYAGIEWSSLSEGAEKLLAFLQEQMGVSRIRFPKSSGFGIKPISQEGSERLIRKALQYAVDNDRTSVTLVHKGNIMKFTEGAFRDWGYALAQREFGAQQIGNGPWCQFTNPKTGRHIIVKDCICDAFLQQILLAPADYDVIATPNLNGDYISDALAAQVGGIGIAPGANLSDSIAIFEATHGTAPAIAGKNIANPCSEILSAEMMLRHIGWHEAADRINAAVGTQIASGRVTADLAALIEQAHPLSTKDFGQELCSLIESNNP